MKLEKCPCGEKPYRTLGDTFQPEVACRKCGRVVPDPLAWNRMALAGEMEGLLKDVACIDAPIGERARALLAKLDQEREGAKP